MAALWVKEAQIDMDAPIHDRSGKAQVCGERLERTR